MGNCPDYFGDLFAQLLCGGQMVQARYRSAGMLTGGILLLAVMVPLLWKFSYGTLLLMGIGTSLVIPLYMLPMTSTSFDLMGESAESAGKRVEWVVLRELSLMSGRLLGMLVFIAVLSVSSSTRVIIVLLFALGAALLGSWLLLRHRLHRAASGNMP